ncbi:MAG: hypothetical protein FWH48_12445 [Oscillospiraceae bacterium]|nr:hypothetical protein [Oscillospiraceae bacterium]
MGGNLKFEWGNPENPNIFEQKGYTKADLKKGIRNPFYHKFCRDVKIGVRHEDYELFKKIAESYGLTPEIMMKSYLHRYADLLREEEV